MHFLITGHTGFKGSWLAKSLNMQGHVVSGISLPPPSKSLYEQANIKSFIKHDVRFDIRNSTQELDNIIKEINPEVIIHFAAQPLVGKSYLNPIETFETNIMGTLNVLNASLRATKLRAALIITTDKVYKNDGSNLARMETDPLGGEDPYSASKAAADIVAQSWIKNFAKVPVSIARAGNVIGGGDWVQGRLVPDLVFAYSNKETPILRNPDGIRPWQHVLDCLNGYLMLVNKQIESGIRGEWNFGPPPSGHVPVSELVTKFAESWGSKGKVWQLGTESVLTESKTLFLDCTKAMTELSWSNALDFDQTVRMTVEWYKNKGSLTPEKLMQKQIECFWESDRF